MGLLFLVKRMTSHLVGLNAISQSLSYCCSMSRSSCSLAWSSGDRMMQYRRLSSAKRRQVEDTQLGKSFIMPPTLKKWGTYWFRLVRMYVCMYLCSRYRLETSCMDSSWKNSRRIYLVFPELSPLVKLRPFDKQGDEIL